MTAILQDVTAIQAELAKLRAENAQLKAKASQANTDRLSFKVSAKGAISVYGLGRWPMTLYKEQMLRVLDRSDDIRAFIKANDQALANKGE